MTRIYVPANVSMLRTLAESGELEVKAPVHLVTAALRAEAPDAAEDDLEYTAFDDAGLASVALLPGHEPRRVVVSADVPERLVTEHREGTAADLAGTVRLSTVAAVHVDDADAAATIAAALASSEEPDPAVVENHVLDWYAPSELQVLLSALDSSRP